MTRKKLIIILCTVISVLVFVTGSIIYIRKSNRGIDTLNKEKVTNLAEEKKQIDEANEVIPVVYTENGFLPSSINLKDSQNIIISNSTDEEIRIIGKGSTYFEIPIEQGKSMLGPVLKEGLYTLYAENFKTKVLKINVSSIKPSPTAIKNNNGKSNVETVTIEVTNKGISNRKIKIHTNSQVKFVNKANSSLSIKINGKTPTIARKGFDGAYYSIIFNEKGIFKFYDENIREINGEIIVE